MIEINREITLVASNAIINKPCSAELNKIVEHGTNEHLQAVKAMVSQYKCSVSPETSCFHTHKLFHYNHCIMETHKGVPRQKVRTTTLERTAPKATGRWGHHPRYSCFKT